MKNNERIKEMIEKADILLSDEQYEKINRYIEMLLQTNEQFNLTAITDFDEILIKHFVDSFLGGKFVRDGNKIIDIGSGAGFPSLPLKMLYPEKEFVLLDSLNKRIGFLNEVIKELELDKMQTYHLRIEDAGRNKKFREKNDFVVARAVAKMNTLIEYAMPLLKVGGKLIAYKSSNIADEMEDAKNAMDKLFCKVETIEHFSLFEKYSRTIVVIKKLKETPLIYPRNGNKPKKEPL